MRFIVYGAGGIGGGIAGLLEHAGFDVVAIARGEQLAAMQAGGLCVRTPDGDYQSELEAVGHPSELKWEAEDDVVILTMKSQDARGALDDLAVCAPSSTPVVCAQNGVENERLARRIFDNVYAMLVVMPATFLEPGVVELHATPKAGLLDAGRYPDGVDPTITEICAALTKAGFVARPDARAMRLKYGKLLGNLSNALPELTTGLASQALCGPGDAQELRSEALECYQAAGIDYASTEEIGELLPPRRRLPSISPSFQACERNLAVVHARATLDRDGLLERRDRAARLDVWGTDAVQPSAPDDDPDYASGGRGAGQLLRGAVAGLG